MGESKRRKAFQQVVNRLLQQEANMQVPTMDCFCVKCQKEVKGVPGSPHEGGCGGLQIPKAAMNGVPMPGTQEVVAVKFSSDTARHIYAILDRFVGDSHRGLADLVFIGQADSQLFGALKQINLALSNVRDTFLKAEQERVNRGASKLSIVGPDGKPVQ